MSKQAPTGEYLVTGSFMIRGKKNFIPQTALIFGFGILYKLDENSVARHKNDRIVKINEEDMITEAADDESQNVAEEEDVEVELNEADNEAKSESDDDEEDDESKMAFPDTSLSMRLMSNIK